MGGRCEVEGDGSMRCSQGSQSASAEVAIKWRWERRAMKWIGLRFLGMQMAVENIMIANKNKMEIGGRTVGIDPSGWRCACVGFLPTT
jgi:hypothetical protein